MNARERLMRLIARGGRFTIRELAAGACARYESAGRLVWELAREGVVRCIQPKRNGHRDGVALYEVAQAPKERRPNGAARMWAAMRALRHFTIPELVAAAEVQSNNAIKFVRALEKGGYLRVERPRRPGVVSGSAVYGLAIDAGPKLPKVACGGANNDPHKAA